MQKDITRSLIFSETTQILKLSLWCHGVLTLELPLGPLSVVRKGQAKGGERGSCSSFMGPFQAHHHPQHQEVSDLRPVPLHPCQSPYTMDSLLPLQGYTWPSLKIAALEKLTRCTQRRGKESSLQHCGDNHPLNKYPLTGLVIHRL